MKKRFLLVLPGLLFITFSTFSQSDVQDTAFFRASMDNAISLYYKTIGENAHLYNGSEYMVDVVYEKDENKNLYFLSIFLDRGSVFYDGAEYENIPMAYDILHDDLITTRYNQVYRIRLNADKVSHFTFAGHEFVRLSEDSTHHLPFGNGYYEKLYDGKTQVLAKRQKILEQRYIGGSAYNAYNESDHYFIWKNGVYNPVNTKKSVLALFKEHKKELKKYFRKNKISFSPKPEFAIIQAATYYDQIKN
jgi:hypothetical protein